MSTQELGLHLISTNEKKNLPFRSVKVRVLEFCDCIVTALFIHSWTDKQDFQYTITANSKTAMQTGGS